MDRFVEWLVLEGFEVEMVTEDAKREDNDGEEVATIVRATEDACEEVVFVFYKFSGLVRVQRNISVPSLGTYPVARQCYNQRKLVCQ